MTVRATIDLEHCERQLLEAVDARGWGRVASNGLLALRYYKDALAERDALLREALDCWPISHDPDPHDDEPGYMCGYCGGGGETEGIHHDTDCMRRRIERMLSEDK